MASSQLCEFIEPRSWASEYELRHTAPGFCCRCSSRVLAQGCPHPAAPHVSAYWGAPAAHKRTGEVVGAAESDPERKPDLRAISPLQSEYDPVRPRLRKV